MRGPEYCFSFHGLFTATEGRKWTPEEETTFRSLTQDQRNEWVSQLVAKAPEFKIQDKIEIGRASCRERVLTDV